MKQANISSYYNSILLESLDDGRLKLEVEDSENYAFIHLDIEAVLGLQKALQEYLDSQAKVVITK